MTATGSTKAAAERALREILTERSAPRGGLITAETRISELARHWLEQLQAEGRIETTTLNEYRRVVNTLVLPDARRAAVAGDHHWTPGPSPPQAA